MTTMKVINPDVGFLFNRGLTYTPQEAISINNTGIPVVFEEFTKNCKIMTNGKVIKDHASMLQRMNLLKMFSISKIINGEIN